MNLVIHQMKVKLISTMSLALCWAEAKLIISPRLCISPLLDED